MADEELECIIKSVPDAELGDDLADHWFRELPDDNRLKLILGVDARRLKPGVDDKWPWHVCVNAMEFARGGALEAELRASIATRLRAVSGVVEVVEEAREWWAVSGKTFSVFLAAAAAEVVALHAARIAEHVPR